MHPRAQKKKERILLPPKKCQHVAWRLSLKEIKISTPYHKSGLGIVQSRKPRAQDADGALAARTETIPN